MKVNGNTVKKFNEVLKVVNHEDLSLNDIFKVDHKYLSDKEKIERISFHFAEIMKSLGLDLNDDSLKDTPNRVAKMYVNEIFSGLNEENKPEAKLFDNNYNYNQMLVEKDIKVHSTCEHHFVPIIGKAHVAYISNSKVIGLSKLNRIVEYYSKRPQVQERLTEQIAEELKKAWLCSIKRILKVRFL